MAPKRHATGALTQSLDKPDAPSVPKKQLRKPNATLGNAAIQNVQDVDSSSESLKQFLITAVVALVLQGLSSAIVDQWKGAELASVSRNYESTWKFLALTIGKVLELGVGWYAGYGNAAIAPFVALLHLPQIYLLNAFYQVPFSSLLLELISNFSSTALAFSIYRRPDTQKASRQVTVVDETLRTDLVLAISSALFSTALYALPLLFSLYTWLPTHLAVHWDGLRSLESAHDASLFKLFRHMVGVGWCTIFLLLGYTRSSFGNEAVKGAPPPHPKDFDPITATLGEHVTHNLEAFLFWRQAKPAGRALLKHSAFLALCITVDAAFQSCATIEGCETSGIGWLTGPLPWGALWGVGMLASGLGVGWMAGVLS